MALDAPPDPACWTPRERGVDDVSCLPASNKPRALGDAEGTLHGAAPTGSRPCRITLVEVADTAGLRGLPAGHLSGGRSTRDGISALCTSRWGSGRPMPVQPHRVRRMWSNPLRFVAHTRPHAHGAELPVPTAPGVLACACVEAGTTQVTRFRFFLVRESDRRTRWGVLYAATR